MESASPHPLAGWLCFADEARRERGRLLDRFGLGPRTTPSRTVRSWPIAQLLAYQNPDRRPPALLIVPAPIKAAYIWDLAPGSSAVERCLTAGLQVYMIVWRRPQPGDEWLDLAQYADIAIGQCVNAIREETGQSKVFAAGHSLGGTLAAIFSSLHPQRVQGLIELEGPIEFGAGRLEAAVAGAPASPAFTAVLGNVPGTFMDLTSVYADPVTFGAQPWLDWLATTPAGAGHRLYWQVHRWSLDESPMAQRLFEQVQDELYRHNRFAEGGLRVGDRVAHPAAIDMPILAVSDPRSGIVPPSSIEAYRRVTASTDVEVVDYCGDAGVMLQHVGVLVGRNAHHSLWPRVLTWLKQRCGASEAF